MAFAHLRPSATHGDRGVKQDPRQKRIALAGIELAYFEWGRPDQPTVLLVHATGFHARCWDAVVRALDGGFRVLALDMRGHGRSSKRGPYEWQRFGVDVAAFVAALDLEVVVGAGHSMGGHSLVQATAEHPDRFAKLLLVDPVIMAPDAYEAHMRSPPFTAPEQHPVARRRNEWQSPEQMFTHFAHRHPFSLWREDVLRDYCRYGLLPTAGGFTLACPPLVEATIYMGSAGREIGEAITAVTQPVTVLRAHKKAERDGTMDFSQSPTWEDLAKAFANGRDVYLPELSHFIPMQRPDLVAEHIRALAQP